MNDYNKDVYCECYGKTVEIKVIYANERGRKIPISTCSAANTTSVKDKCKFQESDKCIRKNYR